MLAATVADLSGDKKEYRVAQVLSPAASHPPFSAANWEQISQSFVQNKQQFD